MAGDGNSCACRRKRHFDGYSRMKDSDACRRCGVCCFSAAEQYVAVTGNDWSRLGALAERVAHFIGHRAFMRMANGHCAALSLRRTASGQPDFVCTIYDQRPQVCRDLARGSPQCEGEREVKGPRRMHEASPSHAGAAPL
jgi:uncharacterized protein